MNIKKSLIDRLICAKYLFLKGIKELSRGGHFSASFALLNFQDSAEMILRIIAEQIECHITKKEGFDSILNKINEKSGKELPHRTVLNQLNESRINFKHYGNEPIKNDVLKFSKDLEVFFPKVLRLFLDIDFNSISLADLIEHKRTENYIKKAEQFIDNKDYENAIFQTAMAFEIFYKHHTEYTKDFSSFHKYNYLNFNDHNENHEKIEDWGKKIEEKIIDQQSQLNIIINGINLADYRKYRSYIPESMNLIIDVKHSNETIEKIASFCYSFVIDAIFLMKEHKFVPSYPIQKHNTIKVKVIEKCDILVDGFEKSEIIREAVVGEILNTFWQNDLEAIFYPNNKRDFIEINQDSDKAYVKKDFVEIINNENKI